MAFNPVTDHLKLVQEVPFSGGFMIEGLFFGWSVLALPGMFQEVYRQGIYLGTIHPYEQQPEDRHGARRSLFRLRKGDVIYRLPVAPVAHHFVGTIRTRDYYQRIYDLSIELEVSTPQYVVREYQQSKDPAQRVIEMYKRYFESYAARCEYNQMEVIKTWLNALAGNTTLQYGLKVVNPRWTLRDDPKRLALDDLHLNTDYKIKEIQSDHGVKRIEDQLRRDREREQKAFEREEKRKENAFQREEKLLHQQNEARIKLLNNALAELLSNNPGRIRDALDYNGPVNGILENSLRLLGVFTTPLKAKEEIIDADTAFFDDHALPDTEEVERIENSAAPNSNAVALPDMEDITIQPPEEK